MIAWIRALTCAKADPIDWIKSLSARCMSALSCSLNMACLRNAWVSIELSSSSENRRRAVLKAWMLSSSSGAAFDRECATGTGAATIGSGMQAINRSPNGSSRASHAGPRCRRTALSLGPNGSKSWASRADLTRQLHGSPQMAIPGLGERDITPDRARPVNVRGKRDAGRNCGTHNHDLGERAFLLLTGSPHRQIGGGLKPFSS